MAFRKLNRNFNEGGGIPPSPEPERPKSYSLYVSGKSYTIASLGVSAVGSAICGLYYLLRLHEAWHVTDTDLQTITTLAGGLAGFMLAIPLFLKDLHRGSSFWKHFFVIALVFMLTAAAGVFAFLEMKEPVDMEVDLWFAGALAISFSFNIYGAVFNRLKLKRFKVTIDPELTMVLSLMTLIAGTWLAPANRLIYGFLLLAIYGLYLTIILMTAILAEMIRNLLYPEIARAPVSSRTRIKEAIEDVVLEHKDKALTEQNLIDYLRKDKFPLEQQIINLTIVETLVAEMDAETEAGQPMATLAGDYNGLLIPRWQPWFDDLLAKAPDYLALWGDGSKFGIHSLNYLTTWNNAMANQVLMSMINEVLTEMTGLSPELLADNDSLVKRYRAIYEIYVRGEHYRSQLGLLFVPHGFLGTVDGSSISGQEVKKIQLSSALFYADEDMLKWLRNI